MGHEPYVGLVDAHAESDGGDHYDAVVIHETLLMPRARGLIEPCVVRQRRDALGREPRGGLIHLLARQAVDDSRFARMVRADELQQLIARVVLLGDRLFLSGAEDLADRTFRVESPASVFVPAGVEHGYRVVGGSGLIVHHVLDGRYGSSLLDLPARAKT